MNTEHSNGATHDHAFIDLAFFDDGASDEKATHRLDEAYRSAVEHFTIAEEQREEQFEALFEEAMSIRLAHPPAASAPQVESLPHVDPSAPGERTLRRRTGMSRRLRPGRVATAVGRLAEQATRRLRPLVLVVSGIASVVFVVFVLLLDRQIGLWILGFAGAIVAIVPIYCALLSRAAASRVLSQFHVVLHALDIRQIVGRNESHEVVPDDRR